MYNVVILEGQCCASAIVETRSTPIRPYKKNMCLWSNCFSKIDVAMRLFFFFFFFFLLVGFLNRGKRSEMVSVVSRYERNEI